MIKKPSTESTGGDGGPLPAEPTQLIRPEALVRRASPPATDRPQLKVQALLDDSRHAPAAEHFAAAPMHYEAPTIVKAVSVAPTRRRFIAAGAGLSALACSHMDIVASDGVCSCHAVCTCDTVSGDEERSSTFEAQSDGRNCTCNQVCTCNTVCTCESVGGSDSGGSYSYTYYY